MFTAAACGGDDRSTDDGSILRAAQTVDEDSGREIDPCRLVTRVEAEEVLANPAEVERPREANNEYLATCRYVAPRGRSVAVLAVTVSRKNGQMGFENARRMEEEGVPIQRVSGVGDHAFWVGDPLNALYTLRDTVYLQIGGDLTVEQARSLALRALERFP